jgi:hypothetical protein
MTNVFTLWKSGYNVSHALTVELVSESDKAFKFKEIESGRDYTFSLPKKACSFDKNVSGVINLAGWFVPEGFIRFVFNRFASHYNR